MRPHYYIDLPYEIKRPIECTDEGFVSDNTTTGIYNKLLSPDNEACKEMHDWLTKEFNLLVPIHIFLTPPGGKIRIHRDTLDKENCTKIAQTWGPEESWTIWWESTGEFTRSDVGMSFASEKNSTQIYSANTKWPSLINTGMLHSTINPSDVNRYTLTYFLFKKNKIVLPFYEAVEMFDKYLIKE